MGNQDEINKTAVAGAGAAVVFLGYRHDLIRDRVDQRVKAAAGPDQSGYVHRNDGSSGFRVAGDVNTGHVLTITGRAPRSSHAFFNEFAAAFV